MISLQNCDCTLPIFIVLIKHSGAIVVYDKLLLSLSTSIDVCFSNKNLQPEVRKSVGISGNQSVGMLTGSMYHEPGLDGKG